MPREYKMYINGEWVDACDGEAYDDLNPYTGVAFAKTPTGKRDDAKRAVDAAVAALVAGAFWSAFYWRADNLTATVISHSVWSTAILTILPLL